MTKQEIFEKSAIHLLKQNATSILHRGIDDEPICAYRGDNGLMCAVGCLIPDSEYKPELESKSASYIADMVPSLLGAHTVFLDQLQAIHDRTSPDFWKEKLRHLGNVSGLNTEFLEEEVGLCL